MKVYMLPSEENRSLLRVLSGFTDYAGLASRLQLYTKSNNLDNPQRRRELALLINKICLYNIFKYVETDSAASFVVGLSNNSLGYTFSVNNMLVTDYFKPLMGLAVGENDVYGAENLIINELQSYISYKYNQNSSALNESFVGVFDMFSTYVPVSQVNLIRFELTPTLTPLMFYSDKHLRLA